MTALKRSFSRLCDAFSDFGNKRRRVGGEASVPPQAAAEQPVVLYDPSSQNNIQRAMVDSKTFEQMHDLCFNEYEAIGMEV